MPLIFEISTSHPVPLEENPMIFAPFALSSNFASGVTSGSAAGIALTRNGRKTGRIASDAIERVRSDIVNNEGNGPGERERLRKDHE
jgi:hypothetical protein